MRKTITDIKTLFAFVLISLCISNVSSMNINNNQEAKNKKNTQLTLKSYYKETINNTRLEKNLIKDYGAMPYSDTNQSSILQKAIDEISQKGGGKLIIPKGIYFIKDVYMKSNVHILVDKDAVLKLYVESGSKKKNVAMIIFSPDKESENYIENCSIRGMNGNFTADYSYCKPGDESCIRFIICRMVKNFLISNVNIKDNFTKFCGISLVPSKINGADKWDISRPTDGEISNCMINNANSGYGFCQLHGAKNIFFRNIYSKGGVTLRLETGSGAEYDGVFNIKAKNVRNENGRAAVMMNPHTVHNGLVEIDSVWSRSSSACVLLQKGFIDKKHKNDTNATEGTFSNDSRINNIHAIFGLEAQVDDKEVYILEPDSVMYSKFHLNSYGNRKSFQGPSLATVYDATQGHWHATVTNISSEGFKGKAAGILKLEDIKEREANKWNILNSLPVAKEQKINKQNHKKTYQNKEKTNDSHHKKQK